MIVVVEEVGTHYFLIRKKQVPEANLSFVFSSSNLSISNFSSSSNFFVSESVSVVTLLSVELRLLIFLYVVFVSSAHLF
jgi:hypothetical protein